MHFTLVIFLLASLINLASEAAGWQTGIWLSKPLLMPALAAWFFLQTKNQPTAFRNLMLAGLLFSFGGDTLLLMVKTRGEQFFLAGLVSFLAAHLCYIGAFQKYPDPSRGLVRRRPWLALPLAAYLCAMLAFLWGDLPEAFKIPVAVYSMVLTSMALAATHLGGRVQPVVFQILLAGALLFVLSDSVLALRKFKTGLEIPFAGLMVMTTYLAGQYLLARGAARANSFIFNR